MDNCSVVLLIIMEMLKFPDIKMCGNGQIGKKGCRQKKGMSGKLANIDVSARHAADMSLTFPTKLIRTQGILVIGVVNIVFIH